MPAERIVLMFAGLGHALFHIVAALFLTLALVLGPLWGLAYNDVIALWAPGAFLLGAGAPLAGWLGDKIGETRVMIAFFVGLGTCAALAGLASGAGDMTWALAGLGLFGSIYHPVGTAWVVKNASRQGRAIATVGIAGSVGVALASLVAAGLADLAGWRAAFLVPGILTIGAGLALTLLYVSGRVVDRAADVSPSSSAAAAEVRRAFMALIVSMAIGSLVYQAFSTMLPKWIEVEIGAALGGGLIGIGAIVSLIYLAGAGAQLLGGHFADRGLARVSYIAGFGLKFAALALATQIGGWPVVAAAIVIAFVFDIAAPVENVLIARYTPQHRRGLAYGVRHGIAIAAAPLGVWLVAILYQPDTGFRLLFLVMAALVIVMLAAAFMLPREQRASEARSSRP